MSEETLTELQSLLDKIVNFIDDPILVTDEHHRLILFNQAFRDFTGYESQDLLHKTLHDIFPAEQATAFCVKDEEVCRTGREIKAESEINDAFGTTHTVISKKTPYVNSGGNRYIIGILRDVTEQNRIEDTLRRSEEQFRALAQTAVDAIILTDVRGDTIFWNKGAEKMFGFTEEQMLGCSITECIPEIYKEKHRRGIERAGSGHMGPLIGKTIELTAQHSNGEKFPIELSLNSWGNQEERFFSGIARDISERKEMENRLREISLRDELTGLYNRRGFLTLAEQQLKVSDRKGQATTLSFIDLDGMKNINDRFGHQAGDQALLDTANILNRTFRESDIIARIGGDEFAVMSGEAGAENSDALQNRLQRNLEEYRQESKAEYSLELSMGTVDYHPCSPLSLEQLIKKADERMYEQKMGKRG
ncbi:MAG: PAS domain S-box protein [Desulfuromonadales bacterium]